MTEPFPARAPLWLTLAAGMLLGACSSVPVVTSSKTLDTLELELRNQGRQLDWLAQAQAQHREDLKEDHEALADALRQTIRERLSNGESCPALDKNARREQSRECIMPRQVSPGGAPDKQVVGQVENVLLSPPGKIYRARIDTGAETASLDTREWEAFERDGEDWVRFRVPAGDGELDTLERKVKHYVRIIQSASDTGERRPVVELQFTLGDMRRRAEFTLADRAHLDYPVLLGRNILRDLLIVDISREFSLQLRDMDAPLVERQAEDADESED